MSQYQCGGPSSQNPYASKPRWAVTPPTSIMRRMPIPVRPQPFLEGGCPPSIYAGLARVSPGCPPGRGRLHTCYSPVRRSPAGQDRSSPLLPLDLHVLSLPLAFILSQDQTLRCYLYILRYLVLTYCLSGLLSVLLKRNKTVSFTLYLTLSLTLLYPFMTSNPRGDTPALLGLLSCGIISLFS